MEAGPSEGEEQPVGEAPSAPSMEPRSHALRVETVEAGPSGGEGGGEVIEEQFEEAPPRG